VSTIITLATSTPPTKSGNSSHTRFGPEIGSISAPIVSHIAV